MDTDFIEKIAERNDKVELAGDLVRRLRMR